MDESLDFALCGRNHILNECDGDMAADLYTQLAPKNDDQTKR